MPLQCQKRLQWLGRLAQLRGPFCIGGLVALLGLCSGCASPAQAYQQVAQDHRMQMLTLQGEPFRHTAYFKPGQGGGRLHIYLDHDGLPWATPTQLAFDPTPRDPAMLRMMAQDPHDALYLGRPCYLGRQGEGGCEPWWWTYGRYSRPVVGSLAQAIQAFRNRQARYSRIILIGWSGGGTLAVLLAPQLGDTQGVLTLAGNLNVAAWTRHHGYTPLTGSLDPRDHPPLEAGIRQLHWVGGKDSKVLPAMVQEYAEQKAARWRQINEFTHECCWEARWRELLETLETWD